MERRVSALDVVKNLGESAPAVLSVLVQGEPLPRIHIMGRLGQESRPDSKTVHKTLRALRQNGLVHEEAGFPIGVRGSRGQTIPTERHAFSLTKSGLEIKTQLEAE